MAPVKEKCIFFLDNSEKIEIVNSVELLTLGTFLSDKLSFLYIFFLYRLGNKGVILKYVKFRTIYFFNWSGRGTTVHRRILNKSKSQNMLIVMIFQSPRTEAYGPDG